MARNAGVVECGDVPCRTCRRSRRLRNAFLTLLGIVSGAALVGCDNMCGGEILESQKSPDGRFVAYVYTWDCGATTSANTRVAIVPAGNPMRMSSDQYTVLLNGTGGIYADWTSTQTLTVHKGNVPLFDSRKAPEGIQIAVE